MGKIYPEELKKKAVELYRLDDDVTYAQVGRDLGGISGETIRNWCRQDDRRRRAAWTTGGLTSDEKAELARAAPGEGAVGEGGEDPKSGDGVLREGPAVKYAWIDEMAGKGLWWFSIALACELLEVSRSGFYDWRGSPRPSRDATGARDRSCWLPRSRSSTWPPSGATGRRGSRPSCVDEGWEVNVNRVARLMRRTRPCRAVRAVCAGTT